MKFEQQLDHAHQVLLEKGFLPSSISPIIYRLARRVGIKVPPPQFCAFAVNVLFGIAWFGTIWGVIMWFMQWRSLGVSVFYAFNASLLTGVVFGLLMASWYKFSAKRKGVPSWKEVMR
ncbi:DUF6404 family protein [Enterovibrio norvegicus]|uniref:DUF6404 family protein n=1 Tax=Enterovibrio norvegicus TaxID=188144 RepID=UPI0035542396